MTGREKIEAAFSPAGTAEIAAVVPYEGIYVRDHWEQLTGHPWWYAQSPLIEHQITWRRDFVARTGMDWFVLPTAHSRKRRQELHIEERAGSVFLVDGGTGKERKLAKPRIGGWTAMQEPQSIHPERLATTPEELDALIPLPPEDAAGEIIASGRGDLAAALLAEFPALYPIRHVSSPLWDTYDIWGFEGMMRMVATQPDAVHYACERLLISAKSQVWEAAALGTRGIWIEECLTDMVSPRDFSRFNLPYLQELVEEIHSCGMASIYYYCGDPGDRWEQLLASGADALSLEEGKKGFQIDIEEVLARAGGRCAVLGNLDAIGVLEQASDAGLRAEVERQAGAGRRHGGRFVMSLGSPVTPGTPVERVRRYCDLVHSLGT